MVANKRDFKLCRLMNGGKEVRINYTIDAERRESYNISLTGDHNLLNEELKELLEALLEYVSNAPTQSDLLCMLDDDYYMDRQYDWRDYLIKENIDRYKRLTLSVSTNEDYANVNYVDRWD